MDTHETDIFNIPAVLPDCPILVMGGGTPFPVRDAPAGALVMVLTAEMV